MPEVLQAREGYELWRPNREKAGSKTTKAIVAFVLLISGALLIIITLGGWTRLQSNTVGLMTISWALLYVAFALLVMRWNRGVLPVAAALAVIMVIFAAVAAGGWFARDKTGLDSPALPSDLLGLLTVIVIPVQLLLIVVAIVGFNQGWNVEEERPIGGAPGPDPTPVDPGPVEATPAPVYEQPAAPAPAPEPRTEQTIAVDDDIDGDWADGGEPNPAV
jgi:hypothetical protein